MKSSVPDHFLDDYLRESPDLAAVQMIRRQFEKTLLSSLDTGYDTLVNRVETYLNHFAAEFARADILASTYQRKYRWASVVIYLLSVCAVIVVSAQYIFHLSHLLGVFEIVAMTLILSIMTRGNRAGWHRRWLDYRFLAERIRYGIYIALLVDGDSRKEEQSLVCRWVGDSWCLDFYRKLWNNRPKPEALNKIRLDALKNQLDVAWFADQRDFHARKKIKALRKHKLISRVSELFFGLTLLAATLHLAPAVLHLFHVELHIPAEKGFNQVLTFLTIAFPSIAAACTALRGHFDYKKTADRSAMMEKSLVSLQEKLEQCQNLEEVRDVALEAESLMIQENSDWYVTIGLRKLEAA